tara:strand:- start:9 stop:929 length:921 start_codon:yes stop_codon:yes gene_type:complete
VKVLVTGSSGFLGKSLCKHLEALGYDLTRSNSNICDLRNPLSLEIYNQIEFDQIFHLAAWTQAGDFCLYHPGEQWTINQKINSNLLSWWSTKQPQAKLISIGTSCSYDPQLPLIEDNYLEGKPIDSLYTYAMCKRMLQIGKVALSRQFGLNYLTVVPSTLYGLEYGIKGKQMHFIFDLIRKFLEFKYFKRPIVLWGDGNQRRELVFIEDFINNLIELDKSENNDIFNIGAGEDYSIKEFAQILANITGVNISNVQFDESKYVGALSKVLDNTKIDSKLPKRFKTNLKDGLNKVVNEFEQKFLSSIN